MHEEPCRNRTASSVVRKVALVLGVSMGCVLCTTNAIAQEVVADPIETATNQMGFAAQLAKTIMQYAKQLQQYALQGKQYAQQTQQYALLYQSYEQMFINLQNIGNHIPSFGNNLKQMDANQLAAAECSSSNGTWSINGVMQSVTSSFNTSYVEAQKQICQQAVVIQVDKYNRTALMLARLNYYNALARQTDSDRDSVSKESGSGDMSGNTNQAARNLSDLQTEMADWRARMQTDDTSLATLQEMQSVLAQAALNGKPSLLGKSVQAAALAAALKVNQ